MKLKSGYVKCVDYAKIIMDYPFYFKVVPVINNATKIFCKR